MTSVLNINSSSASEFAGQDKETLTILPNSKNPTTFIIQPPCFTNTSSLLSKRSKSSHLGDLLMKKVRFQTANSSEANSNNQSPTIKGLKETIYETSDNQSNIEEEVGSPSPLSSCDAGEKINLLMPQRSISTPLFSSWNLTRGTSQSSHKQLLNALDTLQKRLVEHQVINLRDAIMEAAQLSQGPLKIPSLNSVEEKMISPSKKKVSELLNEEEESEIYYGEVEYPLLHLAPEGMQDEESKKRNKSITSSKLKGLKGLKKSKLSDCSSPSIEQNDFLLESLIPTRDGTHRSEPEIETNLRELSEQVAELIGNKNKKERKTNKSEGVTKTKDTTKKTLKKDKINEKEKRLKSKKIVREPLLSPVLKSRRLTERKKNKWQAQEDCETELKI